MEIAREKFYTEVETMLRALAEKDPEIAKHCLRVSYFSFRIVENMNIPDLGLKNSIRNAAAVHDIGKIKIDTALLRKEQITDEEYEILKTHTIFDADEYFKISLPKICKEVICQHHERENGSGYPKGLCSGKISLAAKICAVADSFDAMTSLRYYQKSKTKNDAILELKSMAPEFYDLNVVHAFLNSLE